MAILIRLVATPPPNITIVSPIIKGKGQPLILIVRGDLGGATVEFQVASQKDDDAQWETLDNGLFASPATARLEYFPSGLKMRALLTDSTVNTANLKPVFIEANGAKRDDL